MAGRPGRSHRRVGWRSNQASRIFRKQPGGLILESGVAVRRSLRGLVTLLGLLTAPPGCSRDPAPLDASRTGAASREPVAEHSPSPVHPPATQPTETSAPEARASGPVTHDAVATVGNTRLLLRGCQLEATFPNGEREIKEVDLPGSCVFVTTTAGTQVEKTDHGDAVLVVSSKPLAGQPGDCDTKIRAVVVRSGKVAVSKDQQVIRMCGASGPFDSVMFHTLAATST
jgi:hypothetical protein